MLIGRRRRFGARLRQGVLVLETPTLTTYIPVAAIERVETVEGNRLVIVPTVPEGGRPSSWMVNGRSGPAVDAFARVLRQALPVRDAGEPRADGALLVTEAPVVKPPRHRSLTASRAAVSLYLLAAAAMLIAGVLGPGEWLAALMCWLLGSLSVPLRHGVRAGREMVRETWRLRTRGILVEGRRAAGGYEFTDVRGETQRLSDTAESAELVEILYDPESPESAQVGRHTGGVLAFAVLVFLLSLVMTAALAGLGLAGPLAAFHLSVHGPA